MMIRKQLEIAQRVSSIFPEVNSVFATGYPWYVVGNSMKHSKVDEIWHHTSNFYKLAIETYDPEYEYDLIEDFMANANGKSITEYFKNSKEKLLPHDIFETLFDFDFFFVVDGDPVKVGPKIWTFLTEMGIYPVEKNPLAIIQDYPEVIPVDANIISTDQLLDYLTRFSNYSDSTWVTQKEIALIDWGKSMERDWWFGLDMITELSELQVSKKVGDALSNARNKFASQRTYQEILFDISAQAKNLKHPHLLRKYRLIQDPYIRDSISNRYTKLFIDAECATSWFREIYVSEIISEEDLRMRIQELLSKNKKEIENMLEGLNEVPSDKQIHNLVIPIAYYSLSPYLRHKAIEILIRIGRNSNYELKPLFSQLLKYEHSNHIQATIKKYINYEKNSQVTRFKLLSDDNLTELRKTFQKITKYLIEKKYNNKIKVDSISSIVELKKQYNDYFRNTEGGYSFNTILEDIIRYQATCNNINQRLVEEILNSDKIHQSIKIYLRSVNDS